MPQLKPEYAISNEAMKIVEKLCQLYPERYGHVDPSKIGCVALTNKEKREKQSDSKIRGIKMPDALFASKLYIIEFYGDCWETYTPAQRSAMMLKNLDRIPDLDDGPDGSVLPEDLKDNRTLVNGWGVDYMANAGLPDFAASKQPLASRADESE